MPRSPQTSPTTGAASIAALCLALAAGLPLAARAAAAAGGGPSADVDTDGGNPGEPPPLWTAGLFAVAADHAVYPGAERRARNAALLPFVTYRGPVFRIEGGAAGLRALRSPRAELDFSAAASFGSRGQDSGARAGMPAIGTLVEIGPSLRLNLGELPDSGERPPWRLDLPVRAVFDASRDLDYVGLSFEPRLNWRLPMAGDWTPSVYASLLFGNRALNELYYGVAPAYATPGRPAYDASAGLVATRLGSSWSHMLRDKLRLGLHAAVESVHGAANRGSPVVGRSTDYTLAVTLTWTAFRSEQSGVE